MVFGLEVGLGSKSEFYLTMTVTCIHGRRFAEKIKGRGSSSRSLGHTKTHQLKIGVQLYLGYNKLILKELSSECDMVLRRHD